MMNKIISFVFFVGFKRNDFFIYMFSTFGQISMRDLYYSNCHFGSHDLLNQFSPCIYVHNDN